MRLLTLVLSVLVLSCCVVVAQQKYLVSPDQDMIPVGKHESASSIISKRTGVTQLSAPLVCSERFKFGFDPAGGYPGSGNFGSNHKQVMAEWFTLPASGKIDSIFWLQGGSAQTVLESLVYVRVHESIITKSYGPGHGIFGLPCQSWGYFGNNLDLDQGIAAFPDDANGPDSLWHSTNPSGTTLPVTGNELWGLGGYPVGIHTSKVNHVAMSELQTELPVTVGQSIWISFKINSLNTHINDVGQSTTWSFNAYLAKDTLDDNYPARNWKFYEHDSGPSPTCHGIDRNDVKHGWVARGGGDDPKNADLYNFWYSMVVTTNVPPVINAVEGGDQNNTFSSAPRTISYDILDCNPAYPLDPESIGVKSAVLEWSKGPSAIGGVLVDQSPITMTNSLDQRFEADIPGQPCGTTVEYRIVATDVQGLFKFSSPHSYKVVCLSPNQSYLVDTSYACVQKSIVSTGTAIDTSKYFVPHYGAPSTWGTRKDDGGAGPFNMGGAMTIFGDTARWVWVGVNGAIALSKTATDTLDVNSNGFGNSGFDFPQESHHGRSDTAGRFNMPGNFIAPFWNDLLVGDSTIKYGNIRYGAGTDPCEYIVEWDSAGYFDPNGDTKPTPTTFRVVLNKCTGVIEFQYSIVEGLGLDSSSLVGMQADSNATSGPLPGFVYINRNSYPHVTKPRNNWCIRFFPGAATFADAGWNLLSVSTVPNSYSKSNLYPTAVSPAFRYQAGYLPTDPLSNGPGLWMKFNERSLAGGPGLPTTTVTIPVLAGWNMVGTVSKPVLTSTITQVPPGNVISAYFNYDLTGYHSQTNLLPGRGHWVKVTANGSLTLTASSSQEKVAAQAENDLSALNTVTVTDNNGRTQTLYLGDEESARTLYGVSELPPAAPEFDARFSSGRMVEMYPSKLVDKAKYEYSINIATEAYPVRVSWNISHPASRKMVLTNGVKFLGVMEGTGTIKIANANTKTVVVKLGGAVTVPKVFALGQNYPNPFNPTTHFSVDVPRTTEVDVEIYDVLGQKVATLLTGLVEAGTQELEWDGRDSRALQVPTGIYFVRMNATGEGFSVTHKIMLMK